MIEILIGLILVCQVIAVITNYQNRRDVRALNAEALKLAAARDETWVKLRKIEFETIKDLAMHSDTLKELLEDYKRALDKEVQR